ncbi:NADH:flavin oxidoreductase [Pseudohaliea rubra]|uniref:NADH:flavin oxidoreductase/NADH oxidase n=1 Tax=Pseudohaliea rubra DSM 19751 TaxID=1265313 RepID=A0A095WVF8_9GAMM|nr:NADH:flavin oxidoreductase [Pseudohaliea rubra]KGE02614.1 NADH:flavin oxidoreductase/NADH oxidase [Pseudohaliea rubra DSM 19751]
MSDLFEPLAFASGARMKNRFMLAPLTNLQSYADGTLSDDEYRWLTLRAHGGFGATMTCASHVQAAGLGFPGQLGCFSDDHLPGLTRLANGIHEGYSLAILQLHHAGMRSPADAIGEAPLCPSDNTEFGARALSEDEVTQVADAFLDAAKRAEQAGFDGVELHGAHGYLLGQFLSPGINQRSDRYGGSLENRARLLLEIIEGIRARCRPDFLLGLRLSPERFDIVLGEMLELAQQLCREGQLDFLDMSLWDGFKEPAEAGYEGQSLLSLFAGIDRGTVRLGSAGNIRSGAAAARCLAEGADFVLTGRAAILHHDLPRRIAADPAFEPVANPVSRAYLAQEGLGEPFIDYMATWKGFVAD